MQGCQQQADCDSTTFLHVVVRVAVTGFWVDLIDPSKDNDQSRGLFNERLDVVV